MASRSLGTLTLDLIAKTGGYVAGLTKAERETEKWKRSVKKQADAVKNAFGLTAGAIAGSISALTIGVVNSAREIQNLSAVANTSAEEFQKIAFGAEKYGIAQEKVADILKDTSDKVGDFLQTSGGPLKDFFENIAPQVGVTAEQFRKLSGKDALGLYVDSLEKANLSQNEMTFFMEAIASDATLLLPLLKDNAAEYERLAEKAEKFGVVISNTDLRSMQKVTEKIGEIKAAFRGLGNQVAIAALPAIEELVEFLSDEETIENARTLALALVSAFSAAAKTISNVAGTVRFLAEEVAAIRFGAAADDIARLEDKAEEIKKILNGNLFDKTLKLKFIGPKGLIEYYSDEELKAELADLEQIIKTFYESSKITLPTPNADIDPAAVPPPARTGGTSGGSAGNRSTNEVSRFIQNLEKQSELLGKTAIEQELYKLKLDGATKSQLLHAETLLKTIESYKAGEEELSRINEQTLNIQDSLRTEEEAIRESYERRKEIILKNTEVTGDARKELLSRLETDLTEQLSNTTENRKIQIEIDSVNSQAEAIAEAMLSEEEQIAASYERRREIVLNNTSITGEAQTRLLEQLEKDRLEKLKTLEAKRQLDLLQNQETLFGSLAGLAKQFAGEQSQVYKVLFAAEKAAAIARSIIAIQTGVAQAAAQPFPANIAAMASVAAATANIVATIEGTEIKGVAHAGLDAVPQTGTYLLEKGERVTTSETSAKLDRTLEQIKQTQEGEQSLTRGLRIVNAFNTDVIGDYLQSSSGEEVIMNIVQRNQAAF